MNIDVQVVNAFVDGETGGNPAGVVLDADRDRIGASLGLPPETLSHGAGPLVVDTGNAFLVIPLEDIRTLGAVVPGFEAIRAISDDLDLIGYYLFSPASGTPDRDASARMFAPRFGINEEAATGMAPGPLACYLYEKIRIGREVFRIDQGHFMQPPASSVIEVRLSIRDGRVSGLLAGGKARSMSSITVTI